VADPSPARREALTVAQLEARLPEFESAIRAQGLREKTIASYVGYTRFFLRWLAADGTPERWVAQRDRQRTRRVLDDLAHRVGEHEIRAALDAYHAATKSEAAFGALTAVTGGPADLSREDHRDAVLAWLWAWRCRHLRREDHDLTSRTLGEWWEAFSPMLVGVGETLATARLLLPEWSDSDAALLTRLSADPRMVRYIGNGQRWSGEKAADVSRGMVEHWRANGFGWRVVVEKRSGEALGFAALNYLGEGTVGLDADELEIGWWLLPSAWGRGFASESARSICEEAFRRVGAPSVVARLQPENVESSRVATRIGMSHDFDTTGRFGERVAVYRLLATDWGRRRSDEPE